MGDEPVYVTLWDLVSDYPHLSRIVALLLVSMILSIISPLGSVPLLTSSFWLWMAVPNLFPWESWGTEYLFGIGEYYAVGGSMIVMASMFIRILVRGGSASLSYRLSDIRLCLRTFPVVSGGVSPTLKSEKPELNALAFAGVLFGLCSVFVEWFDGDNALQLLMGDYWSIRGSSITLLVQLIMVVYLVGLALSAYSPLFGMVQFVGVISFGVDLSAEGIMYSPIGLLLGLISSLMLIHSIFVHVSFARRPKITLGGLNLLTFSGARSILGSRG